MAPRTRAGAGRALAAIALGAALLAIAPPPARAGELLLRIGDLEVPEGSIVQGDAIAVGGTARIDGTVEGDATVIGGTVDVGGHVTGSVRAEGGNVILRSSASVDGDVTAVGGVVWREPGARVRGHAPPPAAPPLPFPAPVPPPWEPPVPFPGVPWWLPGGLGVLGAVVRSIFQVAHLFARIAFIIAAWVVAVLFPLLLGRVAALLQRDPLAAFAAGLLGWPLALMVGVVLVASVVGLTLVFLLPVALTVGAQIGVTALALLIGRRIRPLAAAAPAAVLGAVILAVVFSLPGVGGLIAFIAATWGLGGVLLLLWERRLRPSPPASPPGGPAPPAGPEPPGRRAAS
jgi:hypothetical protein